MNRAIKQMLLGVVLVTSLISMQVFNLSSTAFAMQDEDKNIVSVFSRSGIEANSRWKKI